MTDNPIQLPRYIACKYSLFISYAHADNEGFNSWVANLKAAIWKRLKLMPTDITALEIHFMDSNGVAAGQLGSELKERVEQSFGMLLVVGPSYVSSGWCEKELGFFSDLYGPEGAAKRLFIAAMTQDAINQAREAPNWRRLLPRKEGQSDLDDQAYVRMYDSDGKRPIKAMTDAGSFTNAFFDAAAMLADALAEKITADHKKSLEKPVAGQERPAIAGPWIVPPTDSLKVVIGPCTKSMEAHCGTLMKSLRSAQLEAVQLPKESVTDYDPNESNPPLRKILAEYQQLIVPVDDSRPLSPAFIGGHAGILAKEWSMLNKPRSIIWFRPADSRVDESDRAAPVHLDYFAKLAPVCSSEAAVANLLFGPDIGNAVKIYIERHKTLPVHYSLATQFAAEWEKLPPDPTRPRLRCNWLDLEDLTTASKDVEAVVLLLPDRIKDMAALVAQEIQVEKFFPKQRSAFYPGVVAVIFSPPPRVVALHNWAGVNFLMDGQDDDLKIEDSEKTGLRAFLNAVWKQYKNDRALTAHQ